jgi:hypothetical protein
MLTKIIIKFKFTYFKMIANFRVLQEILEASSCRT